MSNRSAQLFALRPARRRELVNDIRAIWKVSICHACRTLRIEPSLYHYRSRRPPQADLMQRTKEIAATRVRYGYLPYPRAPAS